MRVFFFDIDGTLASGLKVPLSAAHALKEIRKQGNLVFICTGRPFNYVKEHFDKYFDGCICFNGRYACLNGKTIYEKYLTKEQVETLTKRLDEYKCSYAFFNNNGSFKGGYLPEGYQKLDTQGEGVFNFDIRFHKHEELPVIAEGMKDVCIFNPHGPDLSADVTILDSDKGHAIKEVLKYLKVDEEDSYAFGDGTNDVAMLKAVGHGIAMGNGQKKTKEAAEYVTSTLSDDGIYKALVHYGFLQWDSWPFYAIIKHMKKLLKKYPLYTWITFAAVFGVQLLTYCIPQLLSNQLVMHDITSKWDMMIPFRPEWIIPYVSCYVTWLYGAMTVLADGKKHGYRFAAAYTISLIVCAIAYVVYPTTMTRPEVTGTDIFSLLVKIVYEVDKPMNLCPSLHVIATYFCWRGFSKMEKLPSWLKHCSFIYLILVCCSIVFVKQHVLIDIPAGILVAEIAVQLATHLKLERVFFHLEGIIKHGK